LVSDNGSGSCVGALGVVHRKAGHLRHFLDAGLTAMTLGQIAIDIADLAHLLDHVDGDTNRAALVGDGATDGLANPPRCIGGERKPRRIRTCPPPASARCCPPESSREAQAAVAIAFGDGNHQSQVAGDQIAACRLVLFTGSRCVPIAAADGGVSSVTRPGSEVFAQRRHGIRRIPRLGQLRQQPLIRSRSASARSPGLDALHCVRPTLPPAAQRRRAARCQPLVGGGTFPGRRNAASDRGGESCRFAQRRCLSVPRFACTSRMFAVFFTVLLIDNSTT